MNESLINRIKSHLSSGAPYPPVNEEVLLNAQSQLGFELPELLKDCYLQIGNGGFGPGYGLIGLEGGYVSDFGSLVSTFKQLKSGQEAVGGGWPEGILPFNEWGCNIYSCVDCICGQRVYIFEGFKLSEANYGLSEFFDLWLSGIDVLAYTKTWPSQEIVITNPFTGKPAIVRGRGK